MDETNQQDQPVQNIEDKYNQRLPFRTHKKVALILFAGLFFLVFGAGSFYIDTLSTQTPIIPSITPTISFMSPIPTNNQVSAISPTSTVTDLIIPPQIDYSCQSDVDCVIKDAGSCCGQFLQCMNLNSKPNPDYVKKQCGNETSGSCGFSSVDGCKCVNNKCMGITQREPNL